MPTARQIHTELEKIKSDLDHLRVKLWNQMAEEERWPQPKVKIWILFTKSKVGIEPHPGWIQMIYSNHDAAIQALDYIMKENKYDDHFIREFEVHK